MSFERHHEERDYRRYIDACNVRAFDALAEFIADDVRGEREGLDGWVRGLREVIDAFPDFHGEVQDVIVGDGTLVARLTDSGTHRRPIMGVPATGRHVEIQELAVYRIDGGKVTQCWGDLDSSLRSALG